MIRAIENRRLSERKGKFTYFAERKAVGLCQIAPTRNELLMSIIRSVTRISPATKLNYLPVLNRNNINKQNKKIEL